MARLFLILILSGLLQANVTKTSSESELVSFAQDLYRKNGVNMPRSAFDLEILENHGSVFFIKLLSRNSTLSDDLLQAFLIGGAISQHSRTPMDLIVVVVEIEFSHRKEIILHAEGQCCEDLYNRSLTVDAFTEGCLQMK